MDMNEAVAKALGAERTIAGMTVRQLGQASGIPERSLMRILQADRDIKVNQVEQLAAALKLYPHEIIEHAEVILERAGRTSPDLSNVTHVQFDSANPAEDQESSSTVTPFDEIDDVGAVEYPGANRVAASEGTHAADEHPAVDEHPEPAPEDDL